LHNLLSAPGAVSFCSSSPAAVVLTVWPSGTGYLNEVFQWIDASGAKVMYSSHILLTSKIAELLSVLALYDGEEWLESNCWYHEQPLPDGPPVGPYAGAQWKHALCFRGPEHSNPHAIVLDVGSATVSLWSAKYAIRSRLARLSGNPGNSCIHLTDKQDESVLAQYHSGKKRNLEGGMSCDESYAYACAKAMLHPASIEWLNSGAAGLAVPGKLGGNDFGAAWARYTTWLQAPPHAPPKDTNAELADPEFEEVPSFLPAGS